MNGKKRGRKPGRLYSTTLHICVNSQTKDALQSLADGMSRTQGQTVSVGEVARRLLEGGLANAKKKIDKELAELDRPRHESAQVEDDDPPPPSAPPDFVDDPEDVLVTQEEMDAYHDAFGPEDTFSGQDASDATAEPRPSSVAD